MESSSLSTHWLIVSKENLDMCFKDLIVCSWGEIPLVCPPPNCLKRSRKPFQTNALESGIYKNWWLDQGWLAALARKAVSRVTRVQSSNLVNYRGMCRSYAYRSDDCRFCRSSLDPSPDATSRRPCPSYRIDGLAHQHHVLVRREYARRNSLSYDTIQKLDLLQYSRRPKKWILNSKEAVT